MTAPVWRDDAAAALAAAQARVRARVDWLITDVDLLDALTADAQVDHLLARTGVDTASLRRRVLEHADRQPAMAASGGGVELTYSRGADSALQYAHRLAESTGGHVAAADLLEALAAADEGVARMLLLECGATAAAIRAARPSTPARPTVPAQPVPIGPPAQPAPPGPPAGAAMQPPVPKKALGFLSSARSVTVGLAAGVAVGLYRSALRTGGLLTILVFLPGVVALVGLRVYTAALVRMPYQARLRRWPGEVHLYPQDGEGRTAAWRRMAVRLLPHALLLVLGTIVMTPYLVQFALLSTVPIPILAHNPETITSADIISTVLANVLSIYGPGDLLRLWVGVSMWFWAAPAYDLVRDSREDLAEAGVGGGRLLRGTVRTALLPAQIFLRILKPIDDAAVWFGANVVLATGGISLVLLFLAELTALRWFWN